MTMTFMCGACNCARPIKDSKVDKTHGKQRVCSSCAKRRRESPRKPALTNQPRTTCPA